MKTKPSMTIEQRKILLKAVDVLYDLIDPVWKSTPNSVEIACNALLDVLQCGYKWQEDGE